MDVTITDIEDRVELLLFDELSAIQRANLNDWQYDSEFDVEPVFFEYRGTMYQTGDFSRITRNCNEPGFAHYVAPGSPLAGYHGIAHDTVSSGVVIAILDGDDDGFLRVARFY